jgi:hypothetical protein
MRSAASQGRNRQRLRSLRNPQKRKAMKKNNIWELILKVIVAAITAALTALTTTSCLGFGPL